jgi:hypothetical protein
MLNNGIMTTEEDMPEIPVICPTCDTRSYVPFEEVSDAVQRHNDQLHDGESIAEVDPEVLDALTTKFGEDMGLF